MAKLTLTDISNLSGNPATAEAALNANFAALVAQIELLLSRDGETPNQMTADLDMNGNDILNVGSVLEGGGSAEDIAFDNDLSGLVADTVQEAIDELALGLPADVQVFTSSGTWTKPTGAKLVEVYCTAGGGGGGSGRKRAVGSAGSGGGGAGGGGRMYRKYLPVDLAATEAVTVGLGGAGGAGQTVNSTNGNDGAHGGASSFGTNLALTGCFAVGGERGSSGTAGAGVNGTGGYGGIIDGEMTNNQNVGQGMNGGAGNDGVVVAAANTGGTDTSTAPGGGGGGGGVNASEGEFAGGIGTDYTLPALPAGFGGDAYAYTPAVVGGIGGGNGANGPTRIGGSLMGGGGGGGGGGGNAAPNANGGNGGNGALYGGGGGGGAAGTDGTGRSGNGGAGGNGIVVVITYR